MVKQQKLIRRKAVDELTVFDMKSEEPFGVVENMTVEGMKLVIDMPIPVSKVLYCRMPLPKKLMGTKEVFFDAECRWCKKNGKTGKYDSGYKLRYVNSTDKAVVAELIRQWMIHECDTWSGSKDRKKSQRGGLLSRVFRLRA